MVAQLRVAAFRRCDQQAARRLVLDGLGERWGFVDETLNPDLDDIGSTYAAGAFVCAWRGGALVGTGGFRPLSGEPAVQLHRLSVAASERRHGVGRAVLAELLEEARSRGCTRAMLETTAAWRDAVAFWERVGFRKFDHRDGDVYLELDLRPDRRAE